MAEQEVGAAGRQPDSPGGLTDGQRATFRSAGFWMAIIGWAEVGFGGLAGLACLLAAVGAAPGQVAGAAPSDRVLLALQAVGAVVIGLLTLTAARSFRRVGRDPAAGLPAVTRAAGDVADLYERQVWLAAVLFAVAIGGALAEWW